MTLLFLYDHDCHITFVDGDIGKHMTPEDVIGELPWNLCRPEDQATVRAQVLRIFDPDCTKHNFLFHWLNPLNPEESYCFFNRMTWVGHSDLAFVINVKRLPSNLGHLSEKEHQVLLQIGQTPPVKDCAKALGMPANTLYGHLRRIRSTLDFESVDELAAFAGLYWDTTKGEE